MIVPQVLVQMKQFVLTNLAPWNVFAHPELSEIIAKSVFLSFFLSFFPSFLAFFLSFLGSVNPELLSFLFSFFCFLFDNS